jgi:hypothetical protein
VDGWGRFTVLLHASQLDEWRFLCEIDEDCLAQLSEEANCMPRFIQVLCVALCLPAAWAFAGVGQQRAPRVAFYAPGTVSCGFWLEVTRAWMSQRAPQRVPCGTRVDPRN